MLTIKSNNLLRGGALQSTCNPLLHQCGPKYGLFKEGQGVFIGFLTPTLFLE